MRYQISMQPPACPAEKCPAMRLSEARYRPVRDVYLQAMQYGKT